MLLRNLGLLVALSVFDLGCTLMAQSAGGFFEMNPLGPQGSDRPVSLILLKLASVTMASGILWGLRRYRGAQTASWWLCLVLTLLAFRWLTYNSMFMV